MKLLNTRFDEKSYKGQDVLNHGVQISLLDSPEKTLQNFSAKKRQQLRKYLHNKYSVTFLPLQTEHLRVLRTLWFDPGDVTFPYACTDKHHGFVAMEDGQIIGGIIWREAGNNLFLHQLISGQRGKEINVPSALIWESVKAFHGKQWKNLDIGVSYNPKRLAFFEHFGKYVNRYPIILKAPLTPPVIRMSPFKGLQVRNALPLPWEWGNSTFLPRGSYALYALLRHLQLTPEDNVTIMKTYPTEYVSACVTQQIGKVCGWNLHKVQPNTKVILLIHEFGLRCKELTQEQADAYKAQGIVIVEDCAWCPKAYYPFSDYQIFSLSKLYDINFGGILAGVKLSDEYLWSIGCLDVFKRKVIERFYDNIDLPKRRMLWDMYYKFMVQSGMDTEGCTLLRDAMETEDWVPTVIFHKMDSDDQAKQLVERLETFGVEAGVYHKHSFVFVPIHQNIYIAELEYMFGAVRGFYNLCCDFK